MIDKPTTPLLPLAAALLLLGNGLSTIASATSATREQQGEQPRQQPNQPLSPEPAATICVGMPLSEALALLRSRPDLASLEPFAGDVVTDEGEVLYLATFKTGDDALLITARRSGEADAPGVTALTLWRNGRSEVNKAKQYRNGALEPLDAFPR